MAASVTAKTPRPTDFGGWLDELPFNPRHALIFSLCAVALMFDSMDIQILGLSAPGIAREFKIDAAAVGMIFSATGFGMALGSYGFGVVSDHIGRRGAFQITVAIYAIFTGLGALAESPMQLAALRFLTGVGIGGFIPVDTAIIAEFVPSRIRGRILGLWAAFLPLGTLLAAAVASQALPAWGWRGLFVIGVVPGVLVFLVRRTVPESPRFLVGRGRAAEAVDALQWVAGERPPAEIIASTSRSRGGEEPVRIRELFSPRYRTRTIMIWTVWFTAAFAYFGTTLWLPTVLTQSKVLAPQYIYWFIIGFSAAGIIGRLVIAAILDVIGRKASLLICALGWAVMSFALGQQTSLGGLLLVGFFLGFFMDGEAGCHAPWTPELYPTRIRATGVGWATGAGRVATIFTGGVTGLLVSHGIGAVFAFLAAFPLVMFVVVVFLGVETKRRHLDVAALEKLGEEAAPVPHARLSTE